MQLELLYDSLFFCSRDDLERTMAVCKSTRKMVTAAAKKLALRPIYRVDVVASHKGVDAGGRGRNLPHGTNGEEEFEASDFEASVIDGDFEAVFRRLQHVHVKYFSFEISENPFLQYWMVQRTDFTVKHFYFENLPEDADYGLLESVVDFLRPTTFNVDTDGSLWNEDGYNRKWLDLFTRETFLNSIKTCELDVWADGGLPPLTFVLSEVGYAAYEIICFEGDAVSWSDRLIEALLHGKCSNEKLESVCIQWDVLQGSGQPSRMPKLLDKPAETNVPIPRSDFATCRITTEYKESQCDLFSFPIATQQKQLDIFKWATEFDHYRGGRAKTYALVFEFKNA
ncbi:hypothetical protein AAVH_23852 [Aphelenchoides avenae]|nr:hypothetical protein AAVH_23852 [Aphelenchus avenae]